MTALVKYWKIGAIVFLAGALLLACHERDNALRAEGEMRAKLAALTVKTTHDSTLERAVDTLVRRDTVRLTQWVTKRDTLRTTLRLTDTVQVREFIAVQDSTIHACREAVSSLTTLCQRKDTIIADLRAQLAVVRIAPSASKSQRVLWFLGGLAAGAVADRVIPR